MNILVGARKKKCMLTGNTNICVQRGVAIETQAGKDIIRKCRQSW